jgi:hypothetical protein
MKKIKIDGPEAKGYAELVVRGDNTFLDLTDLWVAPGAPDVQIAFGSNINGELDDSLQHISALKYGSTEFSFDVSQKNLLKAKTVIIYCKQFNAHFGHGVINIA